MGQVILLSLAASLNPTLVGATTVMLLLPDPAKLMLGYLLGALTTSITLGLVIVFALPNSSATTTTESTLSPTADIALGGLALLGAWSLRSGRHERRAEQRRAHKQAKPDKGPPKWQRVLSKGSPKTTFIVGAAHAPGRLLPRRPPPDPQAQLPNSNDGTRRRRLQPSHAVAARGTARQLRDRSGLDTASGRASESMGSADTHTPSK